MQHHSPERNIIHLILFFVFASALGWFINSYPPETIWQFGSFYLLLGFAVFFLFQFILNHLRRAVLVSFSIIILFILRSFNLRHPLYISLLFLLLISIEISITRIRK